MHVWFVCACVCVRSNIESPNESLLFCAFVSNTIKGPCIRCSKEEEEKDPTSCRKTKYRHEITCIDPGPDGGDSSSVRETFVMFEACKVHASRTPLSLVFFIGMMFLILVCSSPVVAIRKRRLAR